MSWMEKLQKNLTTAEELIEPLHLSETDYQQLRDEIARFPMSVSQYYFSLINLDDPGDPIRKMAIPARRYLSSEGQLDTSGENANTVLRGVQHKYRQTALVLLSSECAMYCRHCFRRRLVGKEAVSATAELEPTADYIEAHPEITNVLLTGGDALVVPNETLDAWLSRLTAMPQLDYIRLGSRVPVTFPDRITDDSDLTDLLHRYCGKKQIYVVTHFNHPREFTGESLAAVRALQRCGIVVKNQTVLMRGINDDPEILGQVLRNVTAAGMVQHYIFQCRPVMGVQTHFQVPLREGLAIVNAANALQSGLGKTADYTMSHVSGKIRILADEGCRMLFQYKQAKNPAEINRVFHAEIADGQAWLP